LLQNLEHSPNLDYQSLLHETMALHFGTIAPNGEQLLLPQ